MAMMTSTAHRSRSRQHNQQQQQQQQHQSSRIRLATTQQVQPQTLLLLLLPALVLGLPAALSWPLGVGMCLARTSAGLCPSWCGASWQQSTGHGSECWAGRCLSEAAVVGMASSSCCSRTLSPALHASLRGGLLLLR
jgi:hypothetical protein